MRPGAVLIAVLPPGEPDSRSDLMVTCSGAGPDDLLARAVQVVRAGGGAGHEQAYEAGGAAYSGAL